MSIDLATFDWQKKLAASIAEVVDDVRTRDGQILDWFSDHFPPGTDLGDKLADIWTPITQGQQLWDQWPGIPATTHSLPSFIPSFVEQTFSAAADVVHDFNPGLADRIDTIGQDIGELLRNLGHGETTSSGMPDTPWVRESAAIADAVTDSSAAFVWGNNNWSIPGVLPETYQNFGINFGTNSNWSSDSSIGKLLASSDLTNRG